MPPIDNNRWLDKATFRSIAEDISAMMHTRLFSRLPCRKTSSKQLPARGSLTGENAWATSGLDELLAGRSIHHLLIFTPSLL